MIEKILSNRWTKFYFALSAAAFVGMQTSSIDDKVIVMVLNILLAFVLAVFMEYKYKIVDKAFEVKSKKYALISLPIAIYAVIEIMQYFIRRFDRFLFETIKNSLVVEQHSLFSAQQIKLVPYIFSAIAGIVALFVVFLLVYAIVSRIKGFATMVWRSTERLERIYLVATMSIFGVLIALTYNLSPIFWGDDTLPWKGINIIFDLDIGYNLSYDVQFYFQTGNIRKLFYPLINFPFALVAHALGKMLFFIPLAYIFFLQLFHVGLMISGGILLTRMCNISGLSKKYFLAIYTFSYPFLVFSLTLERYVLPTFCMILLMYVCLHAPKAKFAVALAAAGTLTTSLVVFPFVVYKKSNRKIKTWFCNFFKLGGCFVAICIFCGMLSYIYNPIQSVIHDLNDHAGGIRTEQKALQFINFVGSIFVQPETALIYRTDRNDGKDFIAYALASPVSVNWIGILLIVLAIAGFIFNKKLRFAQMSFLWVVFAFFVLFAVGWQTRGNEMFLSSLYFGWAFFVLVFLFFEKLLEKQKVLKYSAYSAIFIVMAVININGIIDLIQFGIQYYPTR